jgi:thioredoxin 1
MTFVTISSQEEFETAIKSDCILVDFNAPWCTPCRLQEPILEKISKRFGGLVIVASLNIDNHADIASGLGIQSIPTLIIFKNGKEIQRFVGLQLETTLTGVLRKLVD